MVNTFVLNIDDIFIFAMKSPVVVSDRSLTNHRHTYTSTTALQLWYSRCEVYAVWVMQKHITHVPSLYHILGSPSEFMYKMQIKEDMQNKN